MPRPTPARTGRPVRIRLTPPLRSRCALALLTLLLIATPCAAQTALTAEAGLDRYYRSERWLPLQLTLSNQGAPTRAEVRARVATGQQNAAQYVLPERELPSGANQRYTLHIKAPQGYVSQPLAVDLYQEGRLINTVRPAASLVGDGDWLVASIARGESTVKLLAAVKLPPTQASRGSGAPSQGRNGSVTVNVASLPPENVPTRWHGLEAADLVVIGDVSERDFTTDQQAALVHYVEAGGTLVVTGGVNWRRLASPFFRDLLPVSVTGARTVSGLPELRSMVAAAGPSGSQFAMCEASPKPGARVMLSSGGQPAIVAGHRGNGQVIYTGFDPSLPPFRSWEGTASLWKSLLLEPGPARIVDGLSRGESLDAASGGYGGGGGARLADAPFSISQLDIPAFYVVALFLLAYIIVLVPVNYYVLKAKDRKEYAWITTPVIVLVFTVGAYLIGYGHKGGRTLISKVGMVEAHSGQRMGSTLCYAGLFSPKKTTYDVRVAGDAGGTTLLSEPASERGAGALRIVEDDSQRVRDFGVDMWAMRVMEEEGLIPLGNGFASRVVHEGKRFRGTVRNGTRFTLEDCHLVLGSRSITVESLPPGKQITVEIADDASSTASGSFLPASLLQQIRGEGDTERIRRAALRPLTDVAHPGSRGWSAPPYPLLTGWVREPVAPLEVDGRETRERAAMLMVVHLDQ
jgi:hypothetical protein